MLIELDSAITSNEAQLLERKLNHFFEDAKYLETRSNKFIVCSDILLEQKPPETGLGTQNILRFPGFEADEVVGSSAGLESDNVIRLIQEHPRVKNIYPITGPHKLVSKVWRALPTSVPVGSQNGIGGSDFGLILGPCAIESEARAEETMRFLKEHGVAFVRGGAFKPRTSAYSFRGHGLEGLKMFSSIAREHGLKIVSEVLSPSQIESMLEYVDVFQVGARNSQNFALLHELGKVRKPVLLKRALAGTIDELLHSAEHLYSSGNQDIILCERGIRTFETGYRNTLDLNAIPYLKQRTHLPVVVDPSHGTGSREMVVPMSLAAVMAGADGLLVEIHDQPDEALSDGAQSLHFDEAALLVRQVKQAHQLRESFSQVAEPSRKTFRL